MDDDSFPTPALAKKALSKAERQAKRLKRSNEREKNLSTNGRGSTGSVDQDKLTKYLSKNENELLNFVVKINQLYEEVLHKDAPFMTWVILGMQSSGKSTFMERLLNAVVNIVQENTGTRCPLDVTCIHDETCSVPRAELSGEELDAPGTSLSVQEIFARITEHNKGLADRDKFSTKALKLVYRANNVQNMRFVDTPGIISNKSTGKDNREDIKEILRSEIAKPNTKLCVMLEATEFAKNPIIHFLDESLDGRSGWSQDAKFLMPKFDRQMEDSRTANKANAFFSEFIKNEIYPYLIVTPTLEREDLNHTEMFEKRNKLLVDSNEYEECRFKAWLSQHQQFRDMEATAEVLEKTIKERIGFPNAQVMMRKEMLQHTLEILPHVVGSLQKNLTERKTELQELKERQKFTNPAELKVVVNNLLYSVQERMFAYLDGDLMSSIKYNDQLQTLEDEIFFEDDSMWAEEELDFHSEKEELWRTHIAEMEEYPDEIQPNKPFLGGKQVHRAIEFFGVVMIDSLPDPYELEQIVPNAVGYGGGGLMRENWEGATKQICMVLMQDITHPGVNYLVKHIGYILRRLFHLALHDIMEGQEHSKTFRLIPGAVKDYLISEFDDMLWGLMKKAANNIHTALRPLYTTIDPNLPTFMASADDENADDNEEEQEKSLATWAKDRLMAVMSGSGAEAKKALKKQNKARAENKKAFLRDKRTSMITEEETKLILDRAFQYLVALMEFCLIWFRLQINCYLYEEFKSEMKKSFLHKGSEANWSELVPPEPEVASRIDELENQIKELESSLQEVQKLNKKGL